MKSLQEDIKNQDFKHVYLFCGEEDYLKQQYKKKMQQALLPDGDTMNFAYFEGRKTEPGEVISLADTMPFFSDRRVLLLEDTGFFKNQCQGLPEYLGELPDYLCMIFVESEVDKRSRMYKAVKKQGRVVEFTTQDSNTLMRWVLGMMKKEGKQITQRDMELFLQKTGTDMGNIERELEKLLCYTMGRDVITKADIEAVCTTQITNHIFDMLRAVTDKNQKKALDLYYDLLALKEPPMRILFLIARQFNQILLVKEMMASGNDKSAIASKLKIPPFAAAKLMPQARNFTKEQLAGCVEACVEAEEAVKTGRLGDRLAVELLIMRKY